MDTTISSRPSATTHDVETLVRMAWEGKIRVPHFQRDFRWSWEDVRRLFDSIVRGYPIGSLLLWTRSASAETLQLGALRIAAPAVSEAWWVVDGQQRLTSLANALHLGQAESRFSLAYDLTRSEFIRPPATEAPLVIPLPVLFDLQQILKWFARHTEISDYLDQATAITRRIRQFEVPAYLVSEDDPRVLQDIFDRMNNYGKRLSRAEIFSALNASGEDDHSLTFERIGEEVAAELNFGKIDNDTILAAILARRGTDVRRDIRTEFTRDDDEGRDVAYRSGEEALHRAVAFLQNDAGVPHVAMLAYRYLLVVLARVFAFFPEPDSRHLRLLRRWYWQAAVAGPEHFRGGTPNAARVLCSLIVKGDLSGSIQRLLKAVKTADARIPEISRFATNEAATKMLLCAWWAKSPRNPETAEQYERADLAEALVDQQTARFAVQYLVPYRSIPVEYRAWAATRALMPVLQIDPKEIANLVVRRPTNLSEDQWIAVLESHTISEQMSSTFDDKDSRQFLEARQEMLQRGVKEFLARVCENGFEDTPPLASFVLDDEALDDLD